MLIPTQTYCLTHSAGLFFPDSLLRSLSVWFTSHFSFLFLNYMKMALPFVIQCSLQSCAWLFPVSISVTCYPNHFPFIQLLLLLTVEPVLVTDLTSNSNQPRFHKMSAMQLWDKGHGSFWTTPPHSSRHTTDDQTAFGCLPPIGWIPLLSSRDYKMLHTPFKPFNCWNLALVQSNSLPLFATN